MEKELELYEQFNDSVSSSITKIRKLEEMKEFISATYSPNRDCLRSILKDNFVEISNVELDNFDSGIIFMTKIVDNMIQKTYGLLKGKSFQFDN